MSDTPETDAAVIASGGSWSVVLRETCRRLERERNDAQEKLKRITSTAQSVVDRWEQPSWKDAEPTAAVIYRLRDALEECAK